MNELYHHGIKDQRWGIRRYQNPDGTLTELGRLRYAKSEARKAKFEASADNFARKAQFTRGLTKTVTGTAVAGMGVYALVKNAKKAERAGQEVTVKNLKKIGGAAVIFGLGRAARGIGMMAFNPKRSSYDNEVIERQRKAADLIGLSDDEIKAKTARNNLENEYYKSLSVTAENGEKTTKSALKKYGGVINIVKDVGTVADTIGKVKGTIDKFDTKKKS